MRRKGVQDESLLHQKARAAMQDGQVPKRAPDEIRSRAANAAPCAVCGESTAARGVQLEIEFTRGPDAGVYLVHIGCFLVLKQFF